MGAGRAGVRDREALSHVLRTAAFGPKTGKYYHARRKSKENKGVGIRFQRNNIAEPAVAADGPAERLFVA